MSARCSKCDKHNDRQPHRYCRACHAAYQRIWRAGRAKLFHSLLTRVAQDVQEAHR
jgi:hypothetical protein